MSKRIIIAGGGTGGHIFPAVAIANALKKIDTGIEILFVGAKGKMEMEKVPQAGYNIRGIDIAGFNRSSLIKNISLPFKLVKSFLQVRTIVKNFLPDAIIGVGGYSSFPVLRFGQAKGIPTFIHESNSFAGKSSSLLPCPAAEDGANEHAKSAEIAFPQNVPGHDLSRGKEVAGRTSIVHPRLGVGIHFDAEVGEGDARAQGIAEKRRSVDRLRPVRFLRP